MEKGQHITCKQKTRAPSINSPRWIKLLERRVPAWRDSLLIKSWYNSDLAECYITLYFRTKKQLSSFNRVPSNKTEICICSCCQVTKPLLQLNLKKKLIDVIIPFPNRERKKILISSHSFTFMSK